MDSRVRGSFSGRIPRTGSQEVCFCAASLLILFTTTSRRTLRLRASRVGDTMQASVGAVLGGDTMSSWAFPGSGDSGNLGRAAATRRGVPVGVSLVVS